MTIDRFDYWRRALAGEKMVTTTTPEVGFYRTKAKSGLWEPVAIWHDEETGKLLATRGKEERDAEPDDIWTWCCNSPVSYEDYENALLGKGWPDDEPHVVAALGHNSSGAAEDDEAAWKDEIETAPGAVAKYQKITDDLMAGKAQSLRARLLDVAGRANKKREKEVRPYLDGQQAINKRLMPIVTDGQNLADKLRRYLSDYETAKLRAAQVEADRVAKEAREKAKAEAPADAPAPEPEAPPPPVSVAKTVKGGSGRAATVKSRVVFKQITDIGALFEHLKDDPAVLTAMTNIAKMKVAAGFTSIPGVETETVADVR